MEQKLTSPKTEERLSIRANASQKGTLRRAAEVRHMNISQFVLQASLSEANKILKEDADIKLSSEEFLWLMQKLEEPPRDLLKLRELLNQPPTWNA